VRPVVLPRVAADGVASVKRFHVRPGDALAVGTPLLDYVVDLSVAAPQDCAPVFHMRLVSNEPGRVSELRARAGEIVEPGAVLALVDGASAQGATDRPLRTSSVGIEYDPLFDE
jgi:hypothetical protein